ncbi:MAG TPA: hypothetical protein DDZ67_01640 [Xanthomonadaceae bacterium]|nr:hypothetical protein [Xanthomonadaceae bacterium]
MDTDAVAHAAYGFGTFFWFFLFVFGLILSILWILVPFAIFGIKGILRRIARSLENLEKQNADLLVHWRETPRVVEQVSYRDPDAPVVVARDPRYPPA